jgi:hypothetical protein
MSIGAKNEPTTCNCPGSHVRALGFEAVLAFDFRQRHCEHRHDGDAGQSSSRTSDTNAS